MVARQGNTVSKHPGQRRNNKKAPIVKIIAKGQVDGPYQGRTQSPNPTSLQRKKTRLQTKHMAKTQAGPAKSEDNSVLCTDSTAPKKGRVTQYALKQSLEVLTKKYEVTARKLAASERHSKKLEDGLKHKIEELQKEMDYLKGGGLEDDELDSIAATSTQQERGHRHHRGQYSRNSNKLCMSRAEREVTLPATSTSMEMLDGAAFFLSLDDTLSGADVIGMVSLLNANIFHSAAFIADSLESSRWVPRTTDEAAVFDRAREMAVTILGQDLFNAVDGKWNDGEESDLRRNLLQIALQVCIASFCADVIQSWSQKADMEEVLVNVYGRIYDREQQAVAGRWRALTRATTKRTFEPIVIISKLIHRLSSVLLAVSCWNENIDETEFFNMFHEGLETVVEKTSRIRNAIGENITSMDISALIFAPGTTFDTTTMDDAYRKHWNECISSNRHEGDDVLAGTTEMGLLIMAKKGHGEDRKSRVLMKPKVVLCSALEEEE